MAVTRQLTSQAIEIERDAAWLLDHNGGDLLVNEYDVRLEMQQIEKARMHPIRKARKLLLLTRKVRRAARKFERGIEIMVRDCMDEEAARMQATCDRLVALGREVREVATRTLAAARDDQPRSQPS